MKPTASLYRSGLLAPATVVLRAAGRVSTALALTVLFASCAGTAPRNPVEADAAFDWFSYEGTDPVYDEFSAGPGQYLNPILAGFHPDPSIARAGDEYFLVTSTFSWFPGIPIFRSRDLVNWELIGHVLDRPSQLDVEGLEISEGVFAPTIRYHDGTFYVINTLVGAGGNFVVTATDPAGPWSDPVFLPSVDGIDPSMFFDDDGKVYVTNNGPPIETPRYNGHRAIWIQEFDPEALEMIGPRTLIINGGVDISTEPIWIEAPHIFKVDGAYYLIAAEGGTAEGHSEVVFRSDSVLGPWVPYENNPILTQRHLPADRPFPVTSAGHADFVQTPDGEWWSVFLATRPYRDGYYNIGRETFLLPVEWVDGWPVILPSADVVPYVHDAPSLPRQSPPAVPTSGNFTHRDDFDGDALAPYWNFIRTPREQWYDVNDGRLLLQSRPVGLGDRGQPSFVGRRQQHSYFSAATALHASDLPTGQRAGLAAFQNDDFYYALAFAREEGESVVVLERKSGRGSQAEVVASAPVDVSSDDPLYLRIDGRGGEYDFFYALQADEWIPLLEGADGTILSTRTAGGFVGTYLGLFAEE